MQLKINYAIDYEEIRSRLEKVAVGDFKEINELKEASSYVII